MMSDASFESLIPEIRTVADVLVRMLSVLTEGQDFGVGQGQGVGIGDIDIIRRPIRSGVMRVGAGRSDCPPVMLARSEGTPLEIITSQGRRTIVHPGQTLMLVLSHTYQIRSAGDGEITAVMLPFSALRGITDVTLHDPQRIVLGGVLDSPTWSFLETLIDQPHPWSPAVAYFSETLTVEMIMSLVLTGDARATPRVDPERSLLRRARSHIIAFARDHRMSAQSIADSLGVSVRSLQRAFADADMSLSTEMRRARVDAALALLQSSESSLMSLDEIAQASGYLNAIAMRRAFRAFDVGQPRRHHQGEPVPQARA